jgi:hypothetical protein
MESRCNSQPIILVFSYYQHVLYLKPAKSGCLIFWHWPFFLSGHFMLTNLLLDNMRATAKSTGIEGRIVNLSSVAHHHTYPKGIDFDKLNDKKLYGPLIYCSLWWLIVNRTASNDLLLADTMIKWLMDNLSWQTYCMRRSSLDGSRYYFFLVVFFILISGRIETWRQTCPIAHHAHGMMLLPVNYYEVLIIRGCKLPNL